MHVRGTHISKPNRTLASPMFLRSIGAQMLRGVFRLGYERKKSEHFFLHISKLNRIFAAR